MIIYKYLFYILAIASVLSFSCSKDTPADNGSTSFVWICGDSILLKSNDAGNIWDNHTTDQFQPGIKYIYFANTLRGFMFGNYGQIYKTNKNLSWNKVYDLTNTYPYNYTSAIAANKFHFFACSSYGVIVHLSDSNDVYKLKYTSLPGTNEFNSIDFSESGIGWVAGKGGIIFTTSDFGKNWIKINTAFDTEITAIKAINNGCFIVGKNGIIKTTSDNGVSWNEINSGVTENLNSIVFINNSGKFICGDNGLILKSSDGINWKKTNTNTIKNIWSLSFLNNEYGIAVGSKGLILKTTDGGENWQEVNSGTSSNLYSICFVKRF